MSIDKLFHKKNTNFTISSHYINNTGTDDISDHIANITNKTFLYFGFSKFINKKYKRVIALDKAYIYPPDINIFGFGIRK